MRALANILVTGGAGFIGSNFIRYLLSNTEFRGRIINLDALTYAGNLMNLVDIDRAYGGRRYFFEKADISDSDAVRSIFSRYDVDTVVHLAAESHVDRSIEGPDAFIRTNIFGTYTLLEAAREAWKNRDDVLFHNVSTDEVYGSLGESGQFEEGTRYDPHSPYSATKASSDHLVMAYLHTYGLQATISNCSNNYGPHQFPEKLIPLAILNMLDGKPVPVYGAGRNVRDWIYVDDHNSAVWLIMQKAAAGSKYNVGGENELQNIRLVEMLCDMVGRVLGKSPEVYRSLITFVRDRPGHDLRYAINCSRIKADLGWRQLVSFSVGLEKTVSWYIEHKEWVEATRSGAYRQKVEKVSSYL